MLRLSVFSGFRPKLSLGPESTCSIAQSQDETRRYCKNLFSNVIYCTDSAKFIRQYVQYNVAFVQKVADVNKNFYPFPTINICHTRAVPKWASKWISWISWGPVVVFRCQKPAMDFLILLLETCCTQVLFQCFSLISYYKGVL